MQRIVPPPRGVRQAAEGPDHAGEQTGVDAIEGCGELVVGRVQDVDQGGVGAADGCASRGGGRGGSGVGGGGCGSSSAGGSLELDVRCIDDHGRHALSGAVAPEVGFLESWERPQSRVHRRDLRAEAREQRGVDELRGRGQVPRVEAHRLDEVLVQRRDGSGIGGGIEVPPRENGLLLARGGKAAALDDGRGEGPTDFLDHGFDQVLKQELDPSLVAVLGRGQGALQGPRREVRRHGGLGSGADRGDDGAAQRGRRRVRGTSGVGQGVERRGHKDEAVVEVLVHLLLVREEARGLRGRSGGVEGEEEERTSEKRGEEMERERAEKRNRGGKSISLLSADEKEREKSFFFSVKIVL